MNNAVYAFVYNGVDNWRQSSVDDWDFQSIELTGSEQHLGYRKFDGAICKIVKSDDGKLLAITKN